MTYIQRVTDHRVRIDMGCAQSISCGHDIDYLQRYQLAIQSASVSLSHHAISLVCVPFYLVHALFNYDSRHAVPCTSTMQPIKNKQENRFFIDAKRELSNRGGVQQRQKVNIRFHFDCEIQSCQVLKRWIFRISKKRRQIMLSIST